MIPQLQREKIDNGNSKSLLNNKLSKRLKPNRTRKDIKAIEKRFL